ncbi:hypothetical protein SARC_06854 [Sphaeroforma arctica JP610]|uniref:Importin-9 central HEAT repeats domain-containing protein n=1 Tax=Sphaeroforma arctica JP610 TaxID=667725 RepID=A0A0L0FW49_9EUKA|nr:hypothetical protein SARC_06854 [Sphaeroforma arctica JP610]KNC80791.1 hypothetical protein SARC_06854 [Sphaeroforma arctica JP610]|eukprot:XP_014154693.1 hypothetical protein SARC_06854 [Sphaeroforma arctica JP610]
MTVDILSTIFDLAGATEQYHLVTAAIEQITPLLAQFITPTTPPMYTYKLRRAAISCAGRLAIQHAKTCSALLLNTLLPAVCQAMEEASAVYVKAVVLGEGEETDTSGDDGECGSTELLCAGIEVLVNVTCVPTYKKFLKTNQGNLSYLVLGCMQMTEEQHDTWGDDVNAFLADDSEESMSNTVRNLCIGLISAMMEALPRSTIVSLFTSTSKRLQESQAMRMAPGGSNDKLWWRIAEGALLGLGSVGNIIQDENLHKSMASVDINAIVQSVFAESLTQNNVPYLIGRTLWFAGQFSFALNAGTHTLVVSHSATALGGDFPMPVRILALRTAKSVCEDSGKHTDTLKQTLLPALYATLPALLPVATEELLLLVLDLLALAIPIDAQLAAKYEDKLCPMVVAVWIKFANDPVLCTYISDVYLSLSQTPCLPNLIRRSLSPIVSVLSMAEGQVLPGMQASAVDFLTTNVRACSTPIPDVLVSTALPALMSFLNRTEVSALLGNGSGVRPGVLGV